MKKTLFTLGAFALVALGFAACGNSDCTCKVSDDQGTAITSVKVEDFDGDCDEVKWADLGKDANGDRWSEFADSGWKLVCEED